MSRTKAVGDAPCSAPDRAWASDHREVSGPLSRRRERPIEPHAQGEAVPVPLVQGILDALAAHACVVDEDGRVVAVNRTWSEFASQNGGDLSAVGPGTNYLHVCDESAVRGDHTAAVVADGMRGVLRGDRKEVRIEYPCHSPDVDRYFRLYCARIEGIAPTMALIVHENVSELRNVLLALERTSERLRLAVEGTLDAFYALDPIRSEDGAEDFLIVEANQRAAQSHERCRDALVGQRISQLLSLPVWLPLRDALRAVIATGRPLRREMVDTRDDGTLRRVEEQQLIPLDSGVAIFSRDITERRQAEIDREQAVHRYLQAQKMEAVGRLAGGVAHDFNNLLTVIGSNVELLLEGGELSEDVAELVAEVGDAAGRASDLTRQLLLFSRQEVSSPEIIDLVDVVGSMVKLLRRVIGEDVDLRTRFGATELPVSMDRSQMEQVIMNLAVNARDAMPRGGTITITVAESTDHGADTSPRRHAVVEVTDTGLGMDEETRRRIFEPFFTTKRAGMGTGLGLATVFAIVESAQGEIDVASKPGTGTTFRLQLPLTVAPGDAPTAPTRRPTGGDERILLVEDEPQVRAVVSRILARAGYTVLAASGSVEALRLARRHPIDLVFTDVVMPGMNGRELVDALRARNPALPALFMTGYTDDAVLRAGMAEERLHVLRKPFTPASVARAVRDALDREPGSPVVTGA